MENGEEKLRSSHQIAQSAKVTFVSVSVVLGEKREKEDSEMKGLKEC